MIIQGASWRDLFVSIKDEKYKTEDRCVLIFVSATEADSVCAVRVLQASAGLESGCSQPRAAWVVEGASSTALSCAAQDIFHKEDVHYTLYPVASYAEIAKYCEDDLGDGEVRPVGRAGARLSPRCGRQLDPTICSRPQELRTIILINCGATIDIRTELRLTEQTRVIIVDSHRPVWHKHNDDGDNTTIVVVDPDDPVAPSSVPAAEDPGTSDSEGSDDEENEDEDDEEGPSPQRRRLGEEPGQYAPSSRALRRRQRAEAAASRAAEMETYYGQGSGYGKPSSLLLFDSARSLGYEDSSLAWLAIVGLTDHLLQQRIDSQKYGEWYAMLEDTVAALSSSGGASQPGDGGGADGGLRNVEAAERAQVVKADDYRFALLRHWSLYDAMMFSGYVATRLQTWRDKGRQNLELLLAKMGFPLRQARIRYSSMKPYFWAALKPRLESHASEHNLNKDQLLFASFELRYQNEVRLSAADMVAALTALLSAPLAAGQPLDANFNAAWDACDLRNGIACLKQGIERAKGLHRAIVADGGLILTRNQVNGVASASMWWCDMDAANSAHKDLFQHPRSLVQLAMFLRDAHAQRTGKQRALVLVGPEDAAGNCQVVGIRHRSAPGGIFQSNPFGNVFQEVVDRAEIQLAQEGFDNAVVVMRKSEVFGFMDQLKAVVHQMGASAAAAAATGGGGGPQ